MSEHSAAMTTRKASFIAAAAALLSLSPPVFAEDVAADTRLTSCLERARIDPPAARAAAEKWRDEGGQAAAELCIAMSRFHDGDFAAAADQLEKLAAVPPAANQPVAAARLLAQAGWARLRAGKPDLADKLYGAALEKTPDDADLWIDRAFARAEAERFWDAIADLDHAATLAPTRNEPPLYRAAAHKALGQFRAAFSDLERALELRPDDPQAILLRAAVKAESGDLAGAQADWALTVRLDGAQGTYGRVAANNLEKLKPGQKK
jgi:tetratricopeptide (TPR) repeat protein